MSMVVGRNKLVQQEMYQYKVVYLFLIVCWCYSLMKCDGQASGKLRKSYTTARNSNVQARNSESILNCTQYANDLEILSQFPFHIYLDPHKEGPNISTAILDPTGSLVVEIELRESGQTVPEMVFCLKNLESLTIMDMAFVDGIVPDTLSNLQQLTSLYITNVPITNMTDKLTTLQLLEDLSLDSCSLSYLPSLKGMPYLWAVSVPHNRLSKIEGLMNVFRLFLYNNLFTELPTLTEPQALGVLYMNQNPVKDMTGINSFIHLVDLRLSNSSISVIPSTINELQSLSVLDVSFSRLSDLPNTILKVAEHQVLVLQNNLFSAEQIQSIKTEFSTQRPDVQLVI